MLPSLARKGLLAASAAGALMVAGCATETTYRPATGRGFNRTGYTDRQVEPNRYLVSFAGNTVTERDTVERYLLFRAAELTLQQGYDYFIAADRETDRQSRTYSTPGFGGFGGWGPYGGFGPGFGAWGPAWSFYGGPFGYRRFGSFYGGYGGFGGFGGFNNFDVRTVDRFEATAEIVMRKGPIPRDNVRAFDARAVVDRIGPTVVLPKQG
jgi:hypothetical protein